MVACFRPFLEHLIGLNLSPKTIRKHVDNLWMLGGEIIRDLNETPALRKVPVEDLLLDVLKEPRFMQAFSKKGRFQELMRSIPVHVITARAALVGAATYGLETLQRTKG